MAGPSDEEMEQDRFVNSVYRMVEYVINRKNTMIAIGIAIVIIIAGVLGYYSHRKSQKKYASELLGNSQFALREGKIETAIDSLKKLKSIAPRNKDRISGFYYLGRAYFLFGKYDSAMVFYRKFLDKDFKDKDMKAAAYGAIASCNEELGNFTEAANKYMEAVNKFPSYFNNDNFVKSAAQCYEYADKAEKAIETYQKYLNEYSEDGDNDQVKIALMKLKQREGKL